MDKGYLQHGAGTNGPFRTESVNVKNEYGSNPDRGKKEMNTIYAVVWNDFIPLSLVCENKTSALETAKSIHERAPHINYIKAVELTPDDKLKTLWQPGIDLIEGV